MNNGEEKPLCPFLLSLLVSSCRAIDPSKLERRPLTTYLQDVRSFATTSHELCVDAWGPSSNSYGHLLSRRAGLPMGLVFAHRIGGHSGSCHRPYIRGAQAMVCVVSSGSCTCWAILWNSGVAFSVLPLAGSNMSSTGGMR